MAGKIKFKCLKCGKCCRYLHVKVEGTGTVGLFLLPNERKLFLSYQIRPLYGAGLKGKSRPRPEVIYAYQIVQNRCPHLTEQNLCAIYEKRPIACRAFPLQSFPLGLMMDRRCTWVKQRFQEGESTPREKLDLGDMPKYHDRLTKCIKKYVKEYPFIWLWDLKTRKWVKW